MPATGKSSRADRCGFTLIEVLVALVILSTGIVVVLRAFETSVAALGAARDKAWATMLIGMKFAEAETYVQEHPGQLPPAGTGWFEGTYRNFRWQMTVDDASRVLAGAGTACPVNKLGYINVQVWRDGTRLVHACETFLRPLPTETEE